MDRATLLCGFGAAALIAIGACHVDADPPSYGVISVTETDATLSGTLARGDDAIAFTAERIAPEEFDVIVEVNGMVLTAILHRDDQVAEVDGFADDGAETQIVEADRASLAGLARALAAELDTEQYDLGAVLYRAVSNWSQNPDTVPLQRQVSGSGNRAFVSLGGQFRAWIDATHDGNRCNAFDPRCTTTAQVGNRIAPTFTHTGSGWTTAEPDHAFYPYQTGDCYGNCGGGCPGGNQTLTLDCHDHDQCVRNGHVLASFFCNDEFISASDDEFFAPRCAGT